MKDGIKKSIVLFLIKHRRTIQIIIVLTILLILLEVIIKTLDFTNLSNHCEKINYTSIQCIKNFPNKYNISKEIYSMY